ncbi:recombinase family protein [Actinoallomurus sp. CA-150999]|uniref:recombinase family protein n=1 Tax=Actinoallomurus sp. CA-150999 TaxID=3239887 RepID=UPI003D8DCB4F
MLWTATKSFSLTSAGCAGRVEITQLSGRFHRCTSAADPKRNAHRSGREWTHTTVRSILANPRYTGRQVWNRQPAEHDLLDPANTGLG